MKENLNSYRDAYASNSKFHHEDVLMLSWYADRMIKTIRSKGLRSIIGLGIGHQSVTENLVSKAGGYLKKYTIIEGSSEIINDFSSRVRLTSNVTITNSLFEKFETKEKYDAVEMGFVLEHVDDPLLILKKYSDILKPNGIIFIAVPNARSLHKQIGYHAGMLKNIYRLSKEDKGFGHKRYFDMESLISLIDEAQLKVIAAEGIYLKPFSTAQLHSLELSSKVMKSLFEIGTDYPEISNAIYMEVEK